MATLPEIRPDATNTTGLPLAGGSSLIANPGGATALADDSDATFDGQNTNTSGSYQHGREAANMPTDFESMNTGLTVRVRYGWEAAPSNTTWDTLECRIMAADGVTRLAGFSLAGVTWITIQNNITNTTPVTSANLTFPYVNTGATKAQWDGALVQLNWQRSRAKGGDNLGCRVYEVWINGTYTAAAPPETIRRGVLQPRTYRGHRLRRVESGRI